MIDVVVVCTSSREARINGESLPWSVFKTINVVRKFALDKGNKRFYSLDIFKLMPAVNVTTN